MQCGRVGSRLLFFRVVPAPASPAALRAAGEAFFVCVPRAGAPPFLTSPFRFPVIRRHSGFQAVAGGNDGMTGKTGKT